jgi:hypothetical protein
MLGPPGRHLWGQGYQLLLLGAREDLRGQQLQTHWVLGEMGVLKGVEGAHWDIVHCAWHVVRGEHRNMGTQ